MEQSILCVEKDKSYLQKRKLKSTFPTIQRKDVMEYILSDIATKSEKALLSSVYSEIIRMETKKMQYITEIAISSQEEADIYDLIKRLKKEERMQEKGYVLE